MVLPRAFVIFLVVFCSHALLSGCSHKPTRTAQVDPCAGVDWWEVGRTEGVTGTTLAKATAAGKARCDASAHPIDLNLFNNGYDTGLLDYCTPAQGLAVGRSGLKYEKACPSYLEADFLKQFELGTRILALEIQDSEIAARIETLSHLVKEASPSSAVRAQIEELKIQQSKIDDELERLEATTLSATPNSVRSF